MDDSISIRFADRSDVSRMTELLRSALGETPLLKRTPALFEWKHYDNPFGPSLILLAEKGHRLIGIRALMRWDLETPEGVTLRCLRAVDTATDPAFQGMGIFRDLTMSSIEEARDSKFDLIFNTPNEKSAPGYLRMGWSDVGWINPVVRPRIGRSIKPPTGGIPLLADAVPQAEPFVAGDYPDRPSTGLRTVRSRAYYAWRFMSHPTARFGWMADSIGGGAVVRTSMRSGRVETIISDLLAGAGERVVRTVIGQHRTRYVASSFTEGSPEIKALRKAGLFSIPGLKGLRLVANPLSQFDLPVFDIASWDFAISDLELL